MKPGVRASAPGVVFSLIVTPRIDPLGPSGTTDFYTFGSADVCVSHYRNGRWIKFNSATLESPDALWAWMHENADPHRRNFVFAPHAGEALSMSQFWVEMEKGPVKYEPKHIGTPRTRKDLCRKNTMKIGRVVLGHRVTILDYSRNAHRWVWLSGRQFFPSSEEEIAESLRWEWIDTPTHTGPANRYTRSGRERAALWLTLFQRLCDWWRKNSKAPFALTASGLSKGMLRTHIKEKELCHHRDPRVWKLEREGCFGGRSSVWYYGDIGLHEYYATDDNPAPPPSRYGVIPGPVTWWDVASMYPWLLRDREFPTKLFRYDEKMSVRDLYGYASSYGCIARVTIETDRAEYPERVGDRIYYRRGRFTTTLTAPELRQLRQEGRVTHVHAVALYEMGRPFRAAAGALITLREQARKAKDKTWELFAKLLGTGLGGKLAQRAGAWEVKPNAAASYQWGEWLVARSKNAKPERWRAIAGIPFRWQESDSGEGPYTAAFNYLTAHGRLHMRGIRDELPPGSIIAQDTDGIAVVGDALGRSFTRNASRLPCAGALRSKDTAHSARFLSAKHYWTEHGWVLSGFHNPGPVTHAMTVDDTRKVDNHGARSDLPPCGVTVFLRTSKLKVESHGMKVGRDGWATETTRT